jgi:hypothetical protein
MTMTEMYRWAVDWYSRKTRNALYKRVPEEEHPYVGLDEYSECAVFDTEAEAQIFAHEILKDSEDGEPPMITKQRQDSVTGYWRRDGEDE